jgi:hypothetical protein
MKNVTALIIACLVLVGSMPILASDVEAQGFTLYGKTNAYCKLTHVAYGREVYNGTCTVAESKTATRDLFTIRIGSADPIQFASHRDSGFQYLPHGGGQPVPVRFVDRGHNGVFRWSDFRLEVTEEPGSLAVSAEPVSPATEPKFKLEGKEKAYCRLANVSYGKELYNGLCTVKQTVSDNKSRFAIRMGAADPIVFVSHGGGRYMHVREDRDEPVRFVDRGHSAVFRWGDFRLEVDEFH